MWLLNILPDVAVHLAALLGVIGLLIGFVLGYIPIIDRYKLPIQLISLLLFSSAMYFEGGIAKNKEWADRAMQLEADLASAKNQSEQVNTEIVIKVFRAKQEMKEKANTIKEYIEQNVSKSDKACPIPQSVIISHNAAAKNDVESLKDTPVPTQDHNDLAKPKIKLVPKK